MSLDEMTSGCSAYLKEDYVKRKFLNTWEEICALQKIPSTIEVVHDNGSYAATHYPEINRRVQRILKTDEFPDHMDIYEVIDRCNAKHSLGIGESEKAELSRRVFKEVGKIIKSRRIKDYHAHFGSHLTDLVKVEQDPATRDSTLLDRLTKNLQEGKDNMEKLCEEFIVKQEQEGDRVGGEATPQEGATSTSDEEEEEEEVPEVEDVAADLEGEDYGDEDEEEKGEDEDAEEENGGVDVEEMGDTGTDVEGEALGSADDAEIDVGGLSDEDIGPPVKKAKLNQREAVVSSTGKTRTMLHLEGTESSTCSDSNIDVETVSNSGATAQVNVPPAPSGLGTFICLSDNEDKDVVIIDSD